MRQSSGESHDDVPPRAATRLARWRWLIALVAINTTAAVILMARADGDEPTLGLIIMIGVGVIWALVIVHLLLRVAGVDAEASEIAAALAADRDQQRLLTRWLERARWFRFVGGLCGVIVWFLGARADGNPFVWGFAGIAAGAVAAELHHLRRPSGPRTARIEVRSVRNYLWPFAGWHMVATAALGAAFAVVALVVRAWSSVALACGAVAVIAVGHLVQRRVASRPRPALPDSLRAADDLARELAIDRNLAWPCTYFGLSLVATAALRVGNDLWALGLAGGMAQFYAIGLWWRNRRLGLDWVLRERPEPVLA